MSGSAAPLAPSTSSSVSSTASATARAEKAGFQRQVKPMPVMLRPAVRRPPDQPQPRPVLVDGGHLDVDHPDRQRVLADDVVGDVAAMPAGPPRPRDPQGPG